METSGNIREECVRWKKDVRIAVTYLFSATMFPRLGAPLDVCISSIVLVVVAWVERVCDSYTRG